MRSQVPEAARRLAEGEVIGMPTETVYGLAADATNERAVARIFELKGRPADHPLIVHLGDPAALPAWVADIPRQATMLSSAFWPGPLTLILRKSAAVPGIVTGGQDTVGIRCPSHPLARELLRAFAGIGSGAVAAPSANKFGHVSPTTAAHVREEFGPELFVLDGGPCEVGLESTIVDLSRGAAVLMRPGAVTRDDIAMILGEPPRERDAAAPRASGTLAAHYAPRTVMALVDSAELNAEVAQPAQVAVLALREPPSTLRVLCWINGSIDPVRYGRNLYANLRTLDTYGAKRILVEAPPDSAQWEAVNDRLGRAAAGGGIEDDEP